MVVVLVDSHVDLRVDQVLRVQHPAREAFVNALFVQRLLLVEPFLWSLDASALLLDVERVLLGQIFLTFFFITHHICSFCCKHDHSLLFSLLKFSDQATYKFMLDLGFLLVGHVFLGRWKT